MRTRTQRLRSIKEFIGGPTNNHTNSDQMKRMVDALQRVTLGNPADLGLGSLSTTQVLFWGSELRLLGCG